jgi:very-short-patch-repair endonuclease
MRFDSHNASERATRLARSRDLRREMTIPEIKLWNRLRDRQLAGLKFRRQHRIGPYFADFVCSDAKLVIELDGQSHNKSHDAARDEYMRNLGLEVLRIPVWRFEQDIENACEIIGRTATARIESLRGQSRPP